MNRALYRVRFCYLQKDKDNIFPLKQPIAELKRYFCMKLIT